MKPFFSTAIVLATVTISAISPARAQEANPILLELRPQLQAVMQKVAPDATWQLKGNELTATYKTRELVIYPISSNGTVAAQPRQEIGPANGGFILRVRVFSQIPYFAAEIPIQTRQVHWKTFTTRMNLRTGDNTNFNAPEPEITQTERERVSQDRKEFLPVSQEVEDKYRRLASAGLFEFETYGTFRIKPLTRYYVAVNIARMQETLPDLLANKAHRIKAIEVATSNTGHKLSSIEIESLDGDIRDLQTEFHGELQKLQARITTDLKVREPAPVQPKIELQKPSYLVLTIQTPLNYETLSPQPFTQIIEDAARENNRRADEQ